MPLANVLQPLITVFEAVIRFFHGIVGSWGLSIILLTVVVRAALLPLTLKQFKSMQRLAQVAPELKKIQERYKEDKQRQNQAVMEFYRENKVNPFASCLPIVAQLPVFFSLFYMLRKDLRVDICPERQIGHLANPISCGHSPASKFLFIPDLTDRTHGAVLITLVVLYVGSQLLSTVLMSTATDRNQKLLMYALPFIFVTFVFRFPAGLLVYWITTNLWTIVQQTVVRRRLGPLHPPKAEGDDATSGGGGGLLAALRPAAAAAGPPEQRATAAAPPPPPRRKKKRSGRRR